MLFDRPLHAIGAIGAGLLLAVGITCFTRVAHASPDASTQARGPREACAPGEGAGADGGPCVPPNELDPKERLARAEKLVEAEKLVDALRITNEALAGAITSRDAETTRAARTLAKTLIARIPHLTFVPPTGSVHELTVKFDDRPVPVAMLSKKFSIDPGRHRITRRRQRR